MAAISALVGGTLFSLGNSVGALTCLMATSQYGFQLFQALPKSQVRVKRLSTAIILDRFTFATLVLVLVANGLLNVENTLISSIIAQSVGCMALLIRQDLGKLGVNLSSFKQAMNPKKSFQFGVFTLVNTLRNLDQVLLGAIAGSSQTGIYGAVAKWFAPLAILSSAVSTITANDAARNHSDIRSSIRAEKTIWLGLSALAVLIPLVSMLASNFVPIILGTDYSESAELLVYLAASASIALFSSPLSSLLQYFGKDKQVSLSVGILTVLYLMALSGFLSLGVDNAALFASQLQVVFQLSVVVTFALLVRRPILTARSDL
jgi:O-antigen/teichoic acid export membrane protein